jgi:hypothetical protein
MVKKTTSVPFVRKYYFALGYSDRIQKVDSPPSIELNEYYLDLLNVNVIEEYKAGREIAERDLVNNIR